jgi:sugar phosphate permease
MAFEPHDPVTGTSSLDTASASSLHVLKRRWLYILPAVFITYSLAYVDRTNYGFGAAAGLAKTLHITDSQSALLGSLFFFGYFLFQIPGAAYARKRSARRLIFFSLVSWGILASLTGVVKQFWALALVRFFLGAAESFILPSMLLLLTKWFTRPERSRANTLLILGNPVTVLWMSAVTGYIIKAFGWQLTFIIEGLPSVLWGVAWYLIIRDRPEDASWMTPDAVDSLNDALDHEQSTIPRVPNIGVALRNPNVILLCAQYFLWSIGVYGFVLWLPVMIQKGASLEIGITGLLSAIPYAFAIVLMLITSYFSDRASQRTRFVWPYMILGGLAFFGSYLTASSSFWVSFVFLIIAAGAMYAPYGPFFAIIPEILPANVAGEVTALVNSCGALGSFTGSYLVGYLQAHTGNSKAGYLLMSGALTLAGIAILLLRPISTNTSNPSISNRQAMQSH